MADLDSVTGRMDLPDTSNIWERMPFQVSIGREFKNVGDSYLYMLDAGMDKKGNFTGAIANQAGNPDAKFDMSAADNYAGLRSFAQVQNFSQLGNPYYKDTRLGANDAINCLWQFNRDDDIVHPINYSDRTDPSQRDGIGMGRVYGSTIEQNQSIAWFTFGVAKFTGVVPFYQNAFKSDLIELNNTGFSPLTLGKLLGDVLGLAVAIPTAPIRWLIGWALRLQNYNINRFYDLRTTMHLYYKYVDSMLVEWLVNAGLYKTTDEDGNTSNDMLARTETLPAALVETGPSIWNIMARKANTIKRGEKKGADKDTTDLTADFSSPTPFENMTSKLIGMNPDRYDNATSNDVKVWSGTTEGESVNWSDLFVESALGATQFVGFRVEKSVDASESFSNSTEQSSFAQQINSKAQELQSKFFDLGGNSASSVNTGVGAVDSVLSGMAGVAQSVLSALGAGDTVSAVSGGAFIDIPERYSGSDFNKSHSLSFQLRSPNGDMVSIYQAIIVPLTLLLAAALPHAAGPNSYQQPFLCRVYCKGSFAVPLGIIDSLSVKRGSAEFGWTYEGLPTCVDVNMSIKDLSPAMYMGIKDSVFQDLLGRNTSFDEYMLTLAGVGAWERLSRFATIQRRTQILMHRLRHTVFNPMYWMDYITDNKVVQFFAAFLPNRLPNN